MAEYTPKDWRNEPDATTPLTAEAMEDLETRLSTYATQVGIASYGTEADLPPTGLTNQVVLVVSDFEASGAATLRFWNGTAWMPIGVAGPPPPPGDWITVPWDGTGLHVGDTLIYDGTDARFEPGVL